MYPRPRRATIFLQNTPRVHVRSIAHPHRSFSADDGIQKSRSPINSANASPIPSQPGTPRPGTPLRSALLAEQASNTTTPSRIRRELAAAASSRAATPIQDGESAILAEVQAVEEIAAASRQTTRDTQAFEQTSTTERPRRDSRLKRFLTRVSSRSVHSSESEQDNTLSRRKTK